MLLNCGVGEDSGESLGCKEIQPVHPKGNQCWIFTGSTDAEAEAPIVWPPDAKNKELTPWKRSWCWERLKAGGEGGDRGWDGWMESPTQWTRVWASSGSWWWTGKPGMPQSMGSQRDGHDRVTELNWDLIQHWCTEVKILASGIGKRDGVRWLSLRLWCGIYGQSFWGRKKGRCLYGCHLTVKVSKI